MLTIVDDRRERITLADMTPAQFMQLAAMIRLARAHANRHVSAGASSLDINSHWILRPGQPGSMALMDLTWEEVFMLITVLIDVLEYGRPQRELAAVQDVLDGLNAAVESSLRIDDTVQHPRL